MDCFEHIKICRRQTPTGRTCAQNHLAGCNPVAPAFEIQNSGKLTSNKQSEDKDQFLGPDAVGNDDFLRLISSTVIMTILYIARMVSMYVMVMTVPITNSLCMNSDNRYFLNSRPAVLNLLHHPLQLQLATGELPLGSFRRLVNDRSVVLEGLQVAVPKDFLINKDHEQGASYWLSRAEAAGKTISVPNTSCCICGGDHLNVDCPEENSHSTSALPLRSVLQTSGLAGATAVLRSYGLACARLLEATTTSINDEHKDISGYCDCYHAWLEAHATEWSHIATICEAKLNESNQDLSSACTVCLSMLYNWIDTEAATTGVRSSKTADPTIANAISDALEALEPGYAAQRDKHQSFVADITGVAQKEAHGEAAERKASAAAAYLAAKQKGTGTGGNDAMAKKVNAAAAYLAAKQKKSKGND